MPDKIKDNYTLSFDNSQEAKERIFDMLLAFFEEHEAYSGESICQSDSPQIEAPNLLSDIAEKGFKFKTVWKE